MQKKEVAVLIGSLRKKFCNRMRAGALAELSSSSMSLRVVEIGDLPYYNDELEEMTPASWEAI